jgi:hypothetical protein
MEKKSSSWGETLGKIIIFSIRELGTGVAKNVAHRRKMLSTISHAMKIFISNK